MKSIFNILIIILLGFSINSNSQTWTQVGLDIDGTNENDNSGYSVSLNDDGTVLAIGSPSSDETEAGKVKVYKNNLGNWEQIGDDIVGESIGDNSGYSVSLSSDGSILAIGASDNSGGGNEAGHVRIFENNAGTWQQIGSDIDGESANNYSGYSISLSADGETVAIGATGNSDNGAYSGQVRVYKNNLGVWEQIGADLNGDENSDYFGFSVSLSSDATTLAIGAPYNDGVNGSNSGQVKIYKNNAGTWEQIGLSLEGEATSDYFGESVSINEDGSVLAIGAHYNDGTATDAGHVRVFKNNLGTWEQIGDDIDGENEDDQSGRAVSISNDGNIVAIGGWYNEDAGLNTGHVRVFENIDNSWMQLGQDIDGEAIGDVSGFSVNLNSSGHILAIGAVQNDGGSSNAGHVRVYELTPVSINELKNEQISIYPNPASDFVNVGGLASTSFVKYKISDIRGKTIISLSNLQEKGIINISSLEKGVYFLSVFSNQSVFSLILIKN